MYRDDDVARGARAHALIDEIAELERRRIAHADLDRRLEAARRELAALEPAPAPAAPGLLVHLCVFGGAAAATFVGYALLF